jgi:hypothetical protein
MRTGLAEGRALGLQKGYEIGEPLCAAARTAAMHACKNTYFTVV